MAKLSKIISNFGHICIKTPATERALVNPAAKGSHQQILARGDSGERHRQEFVNVSGHILDRKMSFSYSSAVNERIIDRNCGENK